MLKGLKKTKTDAPVAEVKKEIINGSVFNPAKRWRKTETKDERSVEGEALEENIVREKELARLCEDLWSQFCSGEAVRATQACEKLFVKQDKYFERLFRQKESLQSTTTTENLLFGADAFKSSSSSSTANDSSKQSGFDAEKYRQGIQSERRSNESNLNYDDAAIDFFKKYKTAYNEDEIHDQEYIDKQILPIGDKSETKKLTKKEEKYQDKKDKKQERYQFSTDKKMDSTLSSCQYCFANKRIQEEQLISIAQTTALIIPSHQRYSKIFHLQIIPLEHSCSLNELDEEVYEEIRNFQKCLVQAFDKIDYEVLFFENSVNLKSVPHLTLECITLPRTTSAEIPVYFKQGMENMESEWNTHKKLYKITREQGGIRAQIPRGFPYFYVDFGLRFGYAHIVEDERSFSKNFAHEIISEILQLEKHKVLNPERSSRDALQNIKESLQPIWRDFDWTKAL